ncbi:hypothetical protein COCON_G00079860 [Conger conger]|uniref:Uncharacterized protein n=1 Tax=Conger conger TaxID=82655 RepID=A0A9Q1DPF9_CONCO|nr:hypothetical protein COCON_G00079860 [Conger conger]
MPSGTRPIPAWDSRRESPVTGKSVTSCYIPGLDGFPNSCDRADINPEQGQDVSSVGLPWKHQTGSSPGLVKVLGFWSGTQTYGHANLLQPCEGMLRNFGTFCGTISTDTRTSVIQGV